MRKFALQSFGLAVLCMGATAIAAPPAAPTIGAVTSVGCKSNRVAYTDNQGGGGNAETGFRLDRSTAGPGGPWSVVATRPSGGASVTNRPIDALPPVEDVTYYYRVCATNSTGEGCSAGSASFLTPLCAPINLTVSALISSCSKLRLNWTDRSVVNTHYSIERRLNNSGAFSVITNVTQQTGPYDDPGLAGGTVYGYRIRAFNSGSGNFSGYSNTNNPAPPTTACNATK